MNKDKKEKRKKNSGNLIVRIVALPIGGLIGYLLSYSAFAIFDGFFNKLPSFAITLIMASCITLFAIIAFLSAPPFGAMVVKIGFSLEKHFGQYSPRDITAGGLGLVVGLFVAFLLSDLIALIPIAPLSVSLTVLIYFICGVIGMLFGTKKLGGIIVIKDKSADARDAKNFSPLKVVDTSAIIDGRILDLINTGFLEGTFIIPSFVLDELRLIADSPDSIKRARGKRGLDIATNMQSSDKIKVIISDEDFSTKLDVDSKLLKLAETMNAKVLTCDYNLNKVAKVLQLTVLNINELANAIKKVVFPGENMTIEIEKRGKDASQGIGHLEDGTMVVVEHGGNNIGEAVDVIVTTSLQTNAGRMIFARIKK